MYIYTTLPLSALFEQDMLGEKAGLSNVTNTDMNSICSKKMKTLKKARENSHHTQTLYIS